MTIDELANLIKSRRSIRSWQEKPVPVDLLSRAVEIATYAPNGGNQQNWYFYIITRKDTITAIADAVQESANYFASLPEAKEMGDNLTRMLQRASFFRSAPAAIAVACSRYQSPMDKILEMREETDPRVRQMRDWRNIADTRIQSVSAAIAYLLLVLHAMGLGAVWMTGPMQAKGEIEKILRVQPGMDLVAFIPVGYPAETPPLRERKPVTEICQIIS